MLTNRPTKAFTRIEQQIWHAAFAAAANEPNTDDETHVMLFCVLRANTAVRLYRLAKATVGPWVGQAE